MTDPHTGPPANTGPGRQPGEMSSGTGMDTSTSGPTTAKRTSSAQTSVPQQLGHQQERIAGQTEIAGQAEMMGTPGFGSLTEPISAAARATWGAVLLGGIGMVALGIALLVWPNASLTIVAILIGAAVLVSGLVRLYEGFTARAESGGMRTAYVVIGLVAVVAGIYLLRHHALSLFVVAFVTGVYFIMHGVSDLGVAFSGLAPNRGLRGVLGLFSLAAGIIMIIWPGITLVLLLTIVAAWLIFYGLVLAALSFGLRRAAKETRPASVSSGQLAASTG